MAQLTVQPTWLVYLVVATLVYLESAVVLGFVLPGETAALAGGVAVALGTTSLAGTAAVVVAAALLGDTTAYLLGRGFGDRLVSARLLRRVRRRVEGAQGVLTRRGPVSLVAARWTPVVRTVAPALAGSARMPYPTFLRWNGIACVVWGGTCVVLGSVAGESWAAVSSWMGTVTAVAVGAAGLAWLVARAVRTRRARLAVAAAPVAA